MRKKASASISKKKSAPKLKFTENTLQKQMLHDLEKRISLHVGSFLILTEEGDPTQIAFAHQKARSEFLKFAPEMNKIAMEIGGEIPTIVAEYLDSIDIVLHASGFLDDEKVNYCCQSTQRLESALKR